MVLAPNQTSYAAREKEEDQTKPEAMDVHCEKWERKRGK